jgi:hypothetical protein
MSPESYNFLTILFLKGALAPSAGDFMSYVWLLLTPVTFLFNLIFSFIVPTGGAASASGGSSGHVDARSVAEMRAGATERRQNEAGTSSGLSGARTKCNLTKNVG